MNTSGPPAKIAAKQSAAANVPKRDWRQTMWAELRGTLSGEVNCIFRPGESAIGGEISLKVI
jgi:hypothetical protein